MSFVCIAPCASGRQPNQTIREVVPCSAELFSDVVTIPSILFTKPNSSVLPELLSERRQSLMADLAIGSAGLSGKLASNRRTIFGFL